MPSVRMADQQLRRWDADVERLLKRREAAELEHEMARTRLHNVNAELSAGKVERSRWGEMISRAQSKRIGRKVPA